MKRIANDVNKLSRRNSAVLVLFAMAQVALPTQTFATLYSFCSQVQADPSCPDGATPLAALIQASDGNLYGTAVNGGADAY
jgi:hypothetical protein